MYLEQLKTLCENAMIKKCTLDAHDILPNEVGRIFTITTTEDGKEKYRYGKEVIENIPYDLSNVSEEQAKEIIDISMFLVKKSKTHDVDMKVINRKIGEYHVLVKETGIFSIDKCAYFLAYLRND